MTDYKLIRTKHKLILRLTMILLVFSLSATVFAQSFSDLSGKWRFNHNRSFLDGGTYKWKERILNITQNSNSMIIESTLKWRGKNESVATFKYDLDGRETITTVSDKIIKTVAKRSGDGKTITITKTLLNSDNSIYSINEETYGFDKDGKSLAITSFGKIYICENHTIEIYNLVK